MVPPTQEMIRVPKRRLSSVSDTPSDSDGESVEPDTPHNSTNHTLRELQIGDREAVQQFFHDALNDLQQINCRSVSKKLIQIIEPRKQVNHPYNGRCKSKDRKEMEKASRSTRPSWWPPGVRHKEPDHLVKSGEHPILSIIALGVQLMWPERVLLMQHLIGNSSKPLINNTTVEELREQARTAKGSIGEEKWKILEEIFRVREQQERVEADELGL